MPQIFQLLADYPAFFMFMCGVFGLLVGSFLNVVIHRLPVMLENSWKQEYQSYFHPDETTEPAPVYNIVTPRSRCPSCHAEIHAWQNIPVISWLLLKGRCKNCQAKISARYPLVEIISAVLAVAVAWRFGFHWQTLLAMTFSFCLLALTAIDLDKMLLPDQICLPLMWLGLIISPWHLFVSPVDALFGAALGYLSLWSVYWLFKLLTGKEGMGYGDFKLLAAIGAFVGWQQLPLIILLSSLVGAVIGISQMLLNRQKQGQPIPFGPYLAIAGWISLMWGQHITELYLQWVLA